jgi:hypothetical protein
MDFKNSPKKVRRVSAISQKNRDQVSKNKTIQTFNNKVTLAERADLVEKAITSHTKKMFFGRFENLSNVRKIVISWICVVSILIFSVGIFRGLSVENYSENVFYRGGTYSEGILGEVKTLNPLFTSTNTERSFEQIAFSRIYDIDETGNLKGDLAESVSTSDNYKNFKIKMRNNAVWSDGRKITANDVIFTIKLLREQSINPSGFKAWKNVEISKNSDYEFIVKVPSSSSSVLYSFNFSILPEHILKDIQIEKIRESAFSKNPITSGAFNFKSVQNDGDKTTISLVKNKRYYKGEAYIDNFDIVAFKDEAKLKNALISGEIVASPSLKISEFSESERDKLKSRETNVNRGIYAFLNNSDSVLKDLKVRKAIQIGVDISKVRKEMEFVDKLDFPTLNQFLNTKDLSIPKYDFDQAQKILDEAGWKKNSNGILEKDGKTAILNIATTSVYNYKKAAEEIESQLKKLGFDAKLMIIDKDDKTGAFVQSILQPRNYSILVYEIDLGADPDIYAFWHSSQSGQKGLNFSNYNDAVADDLLLNSRTAQSSNEKKLQITKFTQRWLANSVAIGLGQTKTSYVFRKSVQPYSVNNTFVTELNRYADVIYWSASKSTLYKTP